MKGFLHTFFITILILVGSMFLFLNEIPMFAAEVVGISKESQTSGTNTAPAPAGRTAATANLSEFGLGTSMKTVETFSQKVITFLMAIIGGLSLLGTIMGGTMIMLDGVAGTIEKGKEILLYSLIGLAVALLSYVLTTFMQTIFYSIE